MMMRVLTVTDNFLCFAEHSVYKLADNEIQTTPSKFRYRMESGIQAYGGKERVNLHKNLFTFKWKSTRRAAIQYQTLVTCVFSL